MSLADLAAVALRQIDPETAHGLAIKGLKAGFGPRHPANDPILKATVAGLALPNCLGLAAGFDKDADVPDAMLAAGFGFVECGTVTPLPQAGNPRPRLFRLSQDRAVINRMGFNNRGLEAFAARLAGRKRRGIVGANLGANKDADDRVADYVAGLKRLAGLCDYFTVNVSSPNTPGLRDLQAKEALDQLLGRLADARTGAAPMFLKVAPDLNDWEISDIVQAVTGHGFDGIIVSNTTLARPDTLTSRADAYAKIKAGADAVQLYSALVYEGPGLIGRIKRDLAARLRADGFASVAEAVGKG